MKDHVSRHTRELLELIFWDGHVIDIDFSSWDEAIRLCVIACRVANRTRAEAQIYIVEFCRVSRFAVHFRHLERLKVIGPGFQWRTEGFDLKKEGDSLAIEISSVPDLPILEIVFESVEFRLVPGALLDRALPRWQKPKPGLIRPGLEKMFGTYRERYKTMRQDD